MPQLTRADKEQLLKLAQEKKKREQYNALFKYFPETGPLSREHYPKQMLFFQKGKDFRERALIAGNRSGKTLVASYEMALHLTGLYHTEPQLKWWPGRTFDNPVLAWSIGATHETTRDILQRYLLGPAHDIGSGLIPRDLIIKTTSKPGVPEAIQDAFIRHSSGGVSEISFKSYVQGLDAFMGTQRHVIHMDEEPDNAMIYSECLTRTMTTQGLIMCTFTPLKGLSDTVMSFLPGGKFPDNEPGFPHCGEVRHVEVRN